MTQSHIKESVNPAKFLGIVKPGLTKVGPWGELSKHFLLCEKVKWFLIQF